MKIIGFVGLPGSGKGEASQIARKHGLTVLVMGDVIRQEAERAGLPPTDQNLGLIGATLRSRDGPAAVAQEVFERAKALGKDVVVVDGLRSKDEAEFFRSHADEFHLIEICAPAQARLSRLEARGRPDDPGHEDADDDESNIASCPGQGQGRKLAEALERRECRELSWGLSDAMKTADLKLRNDGSLEDLRRNVERLLILLEGMPAAGMKEKPPNGW